MTLSTCNTVCNTKFSLIKRNASFPAVCLTDFTTHTICSLLKHLLKFLKLSRIFLNHARITRDNISIIFIFIFIFKRQCSYSFYPFSPISFRRSYCNYYLLIFYLISIMRFINGKISSIFSSIPTAI